MVTQGSKYLTFYLGKEVYGIPIDGVKEIIGMQGLTSVPKSKDYIKGVINLRGRIVPIMDLRLRLGMAGKNYTDRTCIIVAEVGMNENRYLAGMVVDAVAEVRNIQSNDIEAPCAGAEIEGDLLRGLGKIDDRVILMIDIEKVMNRDDAPIYDEVPAKQEPNLEECL
jgi:purine-binding chemotaxis protein CheW